MKKSYESTSNVAPQVLSAADIHSIFKITATLTFCSLIEFFEGFFQIFLR